MYNSLCIFSHYDGDDSSNDGYKSDNCVFSVSTTVTMADEEEEPEEDLICPPGKVSPHLNNKCNQHFFLGLSLFVIFCSDTRLFTKYCDILILL